VSKPALGKADGAKGLGQPVPPFEVTANRRLARDIFEMTVRAPDVARKALPGQFMIVRADEPGERIPLTFCAMDHEAGTVSFVYLVHGVTTTKLSKLRPGDALADLAGPLGTPAEVGGIGRVVIVAGGVGAAVALPVAAAMVAGGDRVTAILGARSADLLILQEELRAAGAEVIVTTDDGTAGRKGLVTEPLVELLASEPVDRVVTIGPAIMMKFVCLATKPFGVKTIVSVNPIMVDGTGMCGSCRVTVGGETKFACVHGPEFDGHEVDFDQLMHRLRAYADQEREAFGIYEEKCSCHPK
jgi:ferredoxin/flavodoxin---NADP+ reductase